MAQSVGFTCDLCGGFTTGVKLPNGSFAPPNGWFGVKVRTERDKDNLLDICSNLCLAELGGARYEEETGESYSSLMIRKYHREYRRKKAVEKKTGEQSDNNRRR